MTVTKSSKRETQSIPVGDVRLVKELYPRLREDDAAIERYRLALDSLPPIVVARDGVLVDGFHRWHAHKREGRDTVLAESLGNLSDAEILNESIRRNASHGQQLSRKDKESLADRLWQSTAHLGRGERYAHIAELLAVDERTVQRWTKGARKTEKAGLQAKAWDLWLDCRSERDVADAVGVPRKTLAEWVGEKRQLSDFAQFPGAPARKPEAFDVWKFQSDDDDGKQTYFGKTPRQLLENLLWLYTEPGDIVVDPFAGSGTTIRVAKDMGRRVWSSDLVPFTPTLPIHEHDIGTGWPDSAPKKADLVFLDPPYYEQAKERYPAHERQAGDIADYAQWLAWWRDVVGACAAHAKRLAFLVSPSKIPNSGGQTIDLALDMAATVVDAGLRPIRRVVVPYTTQQATGDQVNKARDAKQLLVRVRDLVVFEA